MANLWVSLPLSGGGTPGPPGPPGSPGSAWYTGSGAPSSGLGLDGDFYLDSNSPNDYYEKISGSWVFQGQLGGSGLTGPAREVIYFDGSGNPTSDAGFTNNGIPGTLNVTKDDGAGNVSTSNWTATQNDEDISDGTNNYNVRRTASGYREASSDGTNNNTQTVTPTDDDLLVTDGTNTSQRNTATTGITDNFNDGTNTSQTTFDGTAHEDLYSSGTVNSKMRLFDKNAVIESEEPSVTRGEARATFQGGSISGTDLLTGLKSGFSSNSAHAVMDLNDGATNFQVRIQPSAQPTIGQVLEVTANPLLNTWEMDFVTPLSGGGITELTGDGTAGPGSGSQTFTLANTAVLPGTYTNATVTFDSKGRATFAANGTTGSGVDVFFGDGFDGAFVLNGTNTYASVMSKSGSTYTLLRSIFATTFQVDSTVTLNTAGYGIWASTSMTVNGTVGSIGNNAAASVAPVSNYGTAGAGGSSLSVSSFRDAILIPNPTQVTATTATLNTGGRGGIGNTGSGAWGAAGQSTSINQFLLGGIGGAGGGGYNSLAAPVAGATVTFAAGFKFVPYSMFNAGFSNHIGYRSYITDATGVSAFVGCPGAGGGAGANLGAGWGGTGGSGGSSPFGVKILAKALTIGALGVIRSNGGNGSAGTVGSGSNWIAGAGGGGAGGGIVQITYGTLTYTPANQIQARGGTGGAGGGAGAGLGSVIVANAGSNGGDGYIHLLNVSTGICSVITGQY